MQKYRADRSERQQDGGKQMKRIKTINSHAGLARWLAETSEEPVGYLARVQVEHIPSPYAYSPTEPIYDWNGRKVIWFETSHKHYEVYEVPAELLRFKTEDEASGWHMRYGVQPMTPKPKE